MTKPRQFLICAACGVEFSRTHKRQKYCSLGCAIWPRVERGAPDECWPWTGAKNDAGYGQIRTNGAPKYAHRLALSLSGSTVADDDDVRHSCDNPICCNPAHLTAGTALENIRDMDKKGRRLTIVTQGEASPHARLTEAQVISIRARYAAGEAGRKLAREFLVAQGTIQWILHRKSWRHI